MVARTPPKQQRLVAPLNPLLIRETVKKVDKCMARLQELQNLVASENKIMGGVSLSPRNSRGYRRTSLRMKNAIPKKSPVGKFPADVVGEWKRMSLPAMLVGETVGEILQASQFAKKIVAAVTEKAKEDDDPETPITQQRKQRPNPENTQLKSRRRKEKQDKLQSTRLESTSPSLQRVRSRINFKVVSPPKNRNVEKENPTKYFANRVSPRNRPWARKTVLFPNPLFLSADSTQQQRFCRTRSPVISGSRQTTPHKFLIKSPPSKFKVKIKSPPVVSISPTNLNKKSSPPKVKVSTASKLRRSFSPSRLANRLVSPLKNMKQRPVSMQKNDSLMSGLKQRPVSMPRRFSLGGRK